METLAKIFQIDVSLIKFALLIVFVLIWVGVIIWNILCLMLSRLVDTFFSRTSWTMLLYAENHSISVV